MKADKDKTNGKIKGGIAKIKAIVPPVPKRFKKQNIQDQTEEALQNVPRITNETVAEHREEILRGARRHIGRNPRRARRLRINRPHRSAHGAANGHPRLSDDGRARLRRRPYGRSQRNPRRRQDRLIAAASGG